MRSRSSSRYQPHVQVTIKSRQIRSRNRSYSVNTAELVERTKYVRRRELSLSRSSSLGSGHWTDLSFEKTLPVRPRIRGYDEAVRYTTMKPFQPRQVLTFSYGYDGDYTGESGSHSPVPCRRSESVLTRHESPYESRKHARVTGYVRRSSSWENVRRRRADTSLEYESYGEGKCQVPSSSIPIVRVRHDDKIPDEQRGWERLTTGQCQAAFTKGSSRRRGSSSRHIIEADDLSESQRKCEKRELVIDSSDDRPLPGTSLCSFTVCLWAY